MMIKSTVALIVAFICAPFLLGVVNRVKSVMAGRKGPPLFQLYYDLLKLLRKAVVYSRSTTWVFRLSPIVNLACITIALAMLPMAGSDAVIFFPGDILLLAYLLGLARFFTVIAALDTASAFEGMGASREVQFAVLGEPALFMALVAIARMTHSWSLTDMSNAISTIPPSTSVPLALVAATVFMVMLAENCRVPVDDPNTHLELTMIHEVMVLDYSGPDLAIILYAASLKLWLFAGLMLSLVIPWQPQELWGQVLLFIGGMLCVAIAVGLIESGMARLRFTFIPRYLVGAASLSLMAVFLS